MSRVFRVSWFRLRTTLHSQWSTYLSLALLIALVGGVSLASLAGARRTDSSFPVYWKSTDPATMQVFSAFDNPQLGLHRGYNAKVVREIARLPYVEESAVSVGYDGNINLNAVTGVHSHFSAGETPPTVIGGDEYLTLDHVTLVAGRLFEPGRADEAVINAQAANELGVHVGSVYTFPIYTDQQADNPAYHGPPYRKVSVRVVGEVVFNSSVVQDEIDALGSGVILLSPRLNSQLQSCCAYYSGVALVVRGGVSKLPLVRSELAGIDPLAKVNFGGGSTPSQILAKAHQEIEPEAVALAVFGAIAAMAALLIGAQLIVRNLRGATRDIQVLRALGANCVTILVAQTLGLTLAVLCGALLAVALALGLSPLAPLGPVRPVYPYPGISFDWTILALGFAGLVIILVAITLLVAREEVRRVEGRTAGRGDEKPWLNALTRASALPLSLATGLRFALRSGRGSSAAPVRSAILGAALAVTVLVATVTFGASLDNLVSHPSLYGWNWNEALLSGFAGQEDLPGPEVTSLFDHDRDVRAWSGANFLGTTVDGVETEVMAQRPRSLVGPPITAGHGLNAANQIVLGRSTLAALHKRIGDTVTENDNTGKPLTLTIVGTATFTPIAKGLEMGTGALMATSDFAPALLNAQQNAVPGPNVVLLRFRSGVNVSAANTKVRAIIRTLNHLKGDGDSTGGLVAHLRPAEISNYRSMGTTPAILGGGLSLGAVIALALTLVSSVRRRRRELALLKTLGYTRRQLAASVAWQSGISVAVGLVAGVPLGVVLGRTLWFFFAREIDAVPVASVPGLVVVLIALGALGLANMVAAVPGTMAARTSAALALRHE